MKTTAMIEIGKDLTYDIYTVDDTLGFMLLGQGNSITEAKLDFLKSKKDMETIFVKEGRQFDFENLDFEYKYDTGSFLRYSPFTLTWLAHATGINKKQLSHYTTGLRHPSRHTLEKIQTAILGFVKDYQQVALVDQ
jgi:hypothetical protein